MPVTTYTVIEGEVVSQNQDGTIHDFLPDPLGHTLGLISTDESVEFEWDYFPYEQVPTAFDGATALRYGGTRGYYSDNYSRPHVGARELRTIHGRWMQVDPIWPGESAYTYVGNSAVLHLDPTGLRFSTVNGGCSRANNQFVYDFCRSCQVRPWPGCARLCAHYADAYYRDCKKPPGKTIWDWIGYSILPGVGVIPGIIESNYVDSLNPVTFAYGNCCGLFRACNTCSAVPGKAIDCTDSCCALHDECLSTWLEFSNPFMQRLCAQRLCTCVASCLSDNQCGGRLDCIDASAKILALYCGIGFL